MDSIEVEHFQDCRKFCWTVHMVDRILTWPRDLCIHLHVGRACDWQLASTLWHRSTPLNRGWYMAKAVGVAPIVTLCCLRLCLSGLERDSSDLEESNSWAANAYGQAAW